MDASKPTDPMPAETIDSTDSLATTKVVEMARPSLATTTEEDTMSNPQNGLSEQPEKEISIKSDSDDDTKPVSLNNETDDLMDSNNGGGQGDSNDVDDNCIAFSSSLKNSGATVAHDLKDVEQSTLSKFIVDPTPTIETNVALEESKDNIPIAHIENYVEEQNSHLVESNGEVGKGNELIKEVTSETIQDNATNREEPVEDIDLAVSQETEIVTAEKVDAVIDPKGLIASSETFVNDAESESLNAPLLLTEDSQQDEINLKVKLEKVETEIETIDIDTDDDEEDDPAEGDVDDDEEESIESPPMEEEDADERKDCLSEYDDVEEVDDGDCEEEENFHRGEELQVIEEYEDAEIEDGDEKDVIAHADECSGIDLSDASQMEDDVDQVIGPVDDFLNAGREYSRGVKRKLTEDADTFPIQGRDCKERDIEWLNSNSSRMHIVDSMCRDAMIRPKVVDQHKTGHDLDSLSNGEPNKAKYKQLDELVKGSPCSEMLDESMVVKDAVLESDDKVTEDLNTKKEIAASDTADPVEIKSKSDVQINNEEQGQSRSITELESAIVGCDKLEKSMEQDSTENKNNETGSNQTEVKLAQESKHQPTITSTAIETEFMDLECDKESPKESSPTVSQSDVNETPKVNQTKEAQQPKNSLPQTQSEISSINNNSEQIFNTMVSSKRKRSLSPQWEIVSESAEIRASREASPKDNEGLMKRTRLLETATEQLHRELEANFDHHDRLLTEYIEKAAVEKNCGSVEKHVEQLMMEITALNDMIRAKELEWNNMIYLRKAKEELIVRLRRKRQVQEILESPLEKNILVATPPMSNTIAGESEPSSKAAAQANLLIQNLQFSDSGLSGVAISKTTQSILQNRANMTTEDLEKEKKNTAKLHRHSHGSSSYIGPAHRKSVSPSNADGRASAPVVSMTAAIASSSSMGKQPPQSTSTPLPGPQNTSHQNNKNTSNISSNNTNSNSSCHQISAATIAAFQALQQQDLLNGQQQFQQQVAAAAGQMVGRQGAIKDVRSIIEDYRQRHPEAVPRRGRRMKTVLTANASRMNDSVQHQTAQQAQQLAQASTNSLLHGILTKRHNQQQSQQPGAGRSAQHQQQQQLVVQPTTNGGVACGNNPNVSGFSPTLARLLTAPERISTSSAYQPPQNPVINLSKNMKSEITITPVVSGNSNREQQQHTANQMYNMMLTSLQVEDQDDNSTDRLVIDEGQEFHENEVPECQGCKRKEAQFVCAGCGNQWYCSRECQVNAWDEHSETCTG